MPTLAEAATPIALEAIRRFESFRPDAYPDPASGGDPWTIGYGATGPGIVEGVVWTREQAEADLEKRVARIIDDVIAMVEVEVPPQAIAALTSFAYNLGEHALSESTLLRRLNANEIQAAAAEFDRWVRAAGKVNAGLVKRRAAEKQLFLSGFATSTS